MFAEGPRLTELQNVQMTSSAFLGGYSVYPSPTYSADDVTWMTSLHGVPQMTSPLQGVSPAIDNGTFPGTGDLDSKVMSFPGLSHLMSTVCNVGEHTALDDCWTGIISTSATTQRCPVTDVISSYQTMMTSGNVHTTDQYPMTQAVTGTSDDLEPSDELYACSQPTRSEYPLFPPSPPDSLFSESSDMEFATTAASAHPPPYHARQVTGQAATTSRPQGTSPAPSPVRSRSVTQLIEPELTPVTRRPRRTHPGTTTFVYNRRNTRPDSDQLRTHFCDYPGIQHIDVMNIHDVYDTALVTFTCMIDYRHCAF